MPAMPDRLFTNITLLGTAVFLGSILITAPVRADNRMAETIIVKALPKETTTPDQKEEKKQPPKKQSSKKQTQKKAIQKKKIDYIALESLGLLKSAREGSLGIDLWQGTSRSYLTRIIPALPVQTEYKTLQKLVKRVLLTRTDAKMMVRNGKEKPGDDLLTLRLKKLNEMGDFEDSVKLYAENRNDPYHEALARTGILSMLFSGQTALACLETKAMEDRFADDEVAKTVVFWQQIPEICNYILSNTEENSKAENSKKVEKYVIPKSSILQKIVDNRDFRFNFKGQKSLESLSPLEKAVLFAENRMDYSDLKTLKLSTLKPDTAALLVNESNLPDEKRFQLMVDAVKTGRKTAESLANFYDSTKTENTGKGWKRLPYLYGEAKAAGKKQAGTEALIQALSLAGAYGTTALLPFAEMLKESGMEDIPDQSIRAGIEIMAQADLSIPRDWMKKWTGNNIESLQKKDLIALISYDIGKNIPSNTLFKKDTFPNIFNVIERSNAETIEIVYTELDNNGKLHNYTSGNAYEKDDGLTFVDDYVMPSIGLLDSLAKAQTDKRLGEVVLLSAIALHDVPPGKLYAGLLREVIDGFVSVGLTKEARDLAKEAIWGLEPIKGE